MANQEMRRYVRMDTVFPVDVFLEEPSKTATPSFHAFTRNISRGGLCVEFRLPVTDDLEKIRSRNTFLYLQIHPLFRLRPISAKARWVWTQKTGGHSPHCQAGLEYETIDGREARLIYRHALGRVWIPRFAVGVVVLLTVVSGLLAWNREHLIRENRLLVERLVTTAESRPELIDEIDGIFARQSQLSKEKGVVEKRLGDLQSAPALVSAPEAPADISPEAVKDELSFLAQRKQGIADEWAALKAKESEYAAEVNRLEQAYEDTRQQIIHEFYTWLKRHQNRHTGLVVSFEGDTKLDRVSYTYDQALCAIAFTLVNDRAKAEAVLDFLANKAKRSEGGFISAYDTATGEAAEWNVHTGPNVWVGMAALHYQKKFASGRYEGLARSVAEWLITLQAQDAEGGLKGGPRFNWFSTEHNLDAYAYLSMMHTVTGDEKFLKAKEKVFAWIMKHSADIGQKKILRGKGDATIATDTFSWSIAALGPARLMEAEFDPEGIMEFAEENCRVTVDFDRPEGRKVRVTGFDFAKHTQIGRGGVISTEWTSQAVVTFKVLAQYFEELGEPGKAALYRGKAYFYLNELQKMIIASLSRLGQGRGCLPYATQSNADTGHGWRTPEGSKTGSVAGTAYGLFAWAGFNPFELE